MARVKSTELTSQKLELYLDLDDSLFGDDWEDKLNKFIEHVKKWDLSFLSSINKSSSFKSFNLLEVVGKLLVHDITVAESLLTDELKKTIINNNKATNKNPKPLDFLGFFSKPKFEESTDSERVKEFLEKIIEGLSNTIESLNKNLTESNLQKYISQVGNVELDGSVDSDDPVSIIFELVKEGSISSESYLTALISLFSKVQNSQNKSYNQKHILKQDGVNAFNRFLNIHGQFKNQSLNDILETEVAPFISNETDLWELTNFIENSSKIFLESILDSRIFVQGQNQNKKFSYMIYNKYDRLSTFGQTALSAFSNTVASLHYLKWYFELGYSKLFNEEKQEDVAVKKDTKEEDSVETAASIKLDNVEGIEDNKKTTADKKEKIKQLQNDIYIANYILKNKKIPEEIPSKLNDGIVGPVTKEQFAEFKELVSGNEEIVNSIDVEQTDSFGEFEKAVAKKIIDSYKEQSSAVTGITSNDPKINDFLGIENKSVSSKFSEYIIKDLINTSDEGELRIKLTNLYKTEFGKLPGIDELEKAVKWTNSLKNKKGNDAWKYNKDAQNSNLS
jgi:hypothetical protein